MKKTLIFTSLIIVIVCLSSAVNINLNSGNKLETSHWTDLSGVLNKIDVDGSDLKINGKLSVNGKICLDDGSCLGECSGGEIWDTNTNSCKVPDGSSELAAGETCKTILEGNPSATSGIKWIDPDGDGGNASFQVYCDMTTDGGGWTLVARRTTEEFFMSDGVVDLTSKNVFNIKTRNIKFTKLRSEISEQEVGIYNKTVTVTETDLETGFRDIHADGETDDHWKTDIKMTTTKQLIDTEDACSIARDYFTMESTNNPNAFFGFQSYFGCSGKTGYYGYGLWVQSADPSSILKANKHLVKRNNNNDTHSVNYLNLWIK